jgi:hypothetical protein
MSFDCGTPNDISAKRCSSFRGKASPAISNALMQPDFLSTSAEMLSTHSTNTWASGTIAHKQRAITLFTFFLNAVGLPDLLHQEPDLPKSRSTRMREEDLLCHFAAYRLMCGQQAKSTLEYISGIRTTYSHWWRTERFGIVGTLGKGNKSLCSKYVLSLDKLNPSKVKEAGRLLPFTTELLAFSFRKAIVQGDWDMAVCLITAYQGVMRVGELTQGRDKFNPSHHLTESDIQFIPSFAAPQLVVLRIGRSKADQMGSRAILHPRDFPVSMDELSTGARLKDMICVRHHLSGLQSDFHPDPRQPLFQRAGQPLKESQVLSFIRSAARSFGFTDENIGQIGTRSLRIGGATKLFQLGASHDTLQHMGGWSTDVYKAYLRSQTSDFHHFTKKMAQL